MANSLKAPITTAADDKFCDIFLNFQQFSWNFIPYLLFFKKRQNLKLLSAANYRWHFIGLLYSTKCWSLSQNVGHFSAYLHALSLKSAYRKIIFSYFSTKTYVVGTQKNSLNETVLLSTQNACLNWSGRKYLPFYAQKFFLSKPVQTCLY